MSRKEQLLEIVGDDIKGLQLVNEIIFIEEQLVYLKTLPFININPKNPMQQKTTPAAKQYKELLQQYNNSLRLLLKMSGDIGESEEESPLRRWAKSRKELQ